MSFKMIATACLSECSKIINVGLNHKKGFFIFILLLLFYTCTGKYVKDSKFDHFVFSQRWLPTACIEYVENGSPNSHFCVLPKNFDFWSIHGLWPTQNTSMGPFFCNRSMPFDISKIQPIEPVMEVLWPNIEGGKSVESLWQHEWDKHGTCAAQLESLNSELKYFNASLVLYKTYNVQQVFIKNNLLPSDKGIKILQLFSFLKNSLGKTPQIHCVTEKKTKRPYLHEIRLCFNKNLELIDCGFIHNSRNSGDNNFLHGLTNCPADEYVILPKSATVTPGSKTLTTNSEHLDYYNKLYVALSFIRFLQWASI